MSTKPVFEQYTGRILRTTWTGLANGETGLVVDYPEWADRNIQVYGTFGAGGSIKIEGSNNNSTWATLTDMSGVALVFTAAGIRMVQENVMFVRPVITAGDGTTSLNIVIVARKN